MPSILVYTDGEVIGDGILRLSFAQALKATMPGVKLTWLSSEYSVYANALKEMAAPIIDELIILPNRDLPFRDFLFRPKALRDRKFDLIIDTQRNVKRAFWLRRIHHKLFISAAAEQLLSSVKAAQELSPHFLERLLQLGMLGIGQPLIPEPLPLPGEWETEATRLLPVGPRYLGLIVGAGHPDKCWPLENFIAVAKQAETQGLVPVFFLGPQEETWLENLRNALPNAKFPLNETATPSPYLTIALGRRLAAAIANDSGGGHLLAAANVPLVSLFRSNSVRVKFLPRSTRVLALAPEDFGATAMGDIPVKAANEALKNLIR